MPIRIYNTLTRKKEEFLPITPGEVTVYVCGVTVYDECHIGHARSAVMFDVIRKYFRYRGFKVTFVKNITDIDDKIIEKARTLAKVSAGIKLLKEMCQEVVKRYIKLYYRDMENLGVEKPDIEPRATEHIPDIIKMIEQLINKNYAYEADGSVYFSVGKFKDYGRLSNQDLEHMLSGVRVDVEKGKKDKLDFALWKSAKEDEPFWVSPWGKGRPGWHIECSLMSMKYLGETFDIHGGGLDLVFPHHENEIAQSCAHTDKPFAHYWMHNGLLSVSGEKMSKSLGNFITVANLLSEYDQEVLRLFFMSNHYASPQDFTYEKMDEQKKALERFYILFNKIDSFLQEISVKVTKADIPGSLKEKIDGLKNSFIEAMDDDFNTALASGFLFDLVTLSNKLLEDVVLTNDHKYSVLAYAKETILELGRLFGLFTKPSAQTQDDALNVHLVEFLIELREHARKNKDFKTSDLIRERLLELGIILEDSTKKTMWRKKV
ncbi:MAG: cysteine--tRNA ligase [Candidatus Omnitrophota bacterium]